MSRSTKHLGELVSALVDGELDHRARDRALAHVAECAACRQAVADERRARDLVAGLRASAGPAPAALVERLVALRDAPAAVPAGTPGRTVPRSAGAVLDPARRSVRRRSRATRPPGRRPAGRHLGHLPAGPAGPAHRSRTGARRAGRGLAGGVLAAAGAAMGAAFVLVGAPTATVVGQSPLLLGPGSAGQTGTGSTALPASLRQAAETPASESPGGDTPAARGVTVAWRGGTFVPSGDASPGMRMPTLVLPSSALRGDDDLAASLVRFLNGLREVGGRSSAGAPYPDDAP